MKPNEKKKLLEAFCNCFGEENSTLWVTSDGDTLSVAEMDNNHLLNSCRKLKSTTIKWATLEKERVRRGLDSKPDKPSKRYTKHELECILAQEMMATDVDLY